MNESTLEVDALGEFLAELNQENDRGAALVAAAMLDERLKEILAAYFVDSTHSNALLSGFNAPLGTFAARASAALALGLIQENEFSEITLIRRIRNEFGHEWRQLSFEKGRLADLTGQLLWLSPGEYEMGATRRCRFNCAVAILLTDLMWRVQLVSKERRILRMWPNKIRSTTTA